MRVADRVESEVGKVTVLVNNAGIMPCLHLESHTPNLIRRVFDINIMAHFWTLEAFLPSMKRRNFGHIVAISSMCGISGLPNAVAYSSTKFAVRGMMEALSEEMRIAEKQIKFTTVYPFTVDTGLVKKPRNRFPSLLNILQPDEVAGQVVKAVRQDIKEISVPASLLKTDNLIRLLPSRLVHHMRDFLDTGVDPEE
ncbi:hypothetical protein AAG570_005911 [Ranatra chinensis]|uniref:Uncharacterized protein n=1 Tax=Ranatra chinensis TaxID=642074 RepID=A0ABD0XWI1_9HEMI